MARVKDFNDTLFELTDEMMAIITPSPVITAGYAMFKNMYAANPDNDVAVSAFWDVAKDNEVLIKKKDLKAMADVLRGVIPMPGMVDDLWNALSDENRDVVGDYIAVLFDQAKSIKQNAPSSAAKEETNGTMYQMYNSIWQEFLILLESSLPEGDARRASVGEAVAKLGTVVKEKGETTDMVLAVLHPSMEACLPPSLLNEGDILKLCLPPSNAQAPARKDKGKLEGMLFPFNRKLPFSDLLDIALGSEKHAEKLATYWHYIKLFTLCVKECPPEIMGMMNQMAAFFRQDALGADFRLREEPAVLTK